MQGRKDYQEKLFLNFQLSERVPQDNFYRKLKANLDLSYLRKATQSYYGQEGQKSIDPIVFFKLMLIGYLENIVSDRKIIEQASLRMDMLYFLGYDIDEPLPWHSTLSRTRQLYGEELFLEVFRQVLRMCIDKGMVDGHRQAVDSAYIKSNASMESLVEKRLLEDTNNYYQELTENEEEKQETPKKQRKRGTKISNSDFISTTDPEARISKKKHQSLQLNYSGQISVDTASHVICGAMADFADKRDSQSLPTIVGQTIETLQVEGISVEEVLADTNYSSGETYRFLEDKNITAYIPVHSSYQPEKIGFTYNKQEDCYICSQGVRLPFKGLDTKKNRSTLSKKYRAATQDCKHCPLKETCCKKARYKQITHTIDKPYYDKAYKLLNTGQAKQKMRLRNSTAEPVWGTLLHFRGMKKVYTKGNDLANKQLLMAAAAYNLKKLMGFTIKSATNVIKNIVADLKMTVLNQILSFFEDVLFALNYRTKNKLKMTLLLCL